MSQPRILCTGNPAQKYTIANGIQQVFPDADFISMSTGYDLTFTAEGSEQAFKEKIKNYNILINASFIENGAQLKVLNIANDVWKYGHVVNIGSCAEHDANYPTPLYADAKQELRNRSLELYNYRFRTTHIVLGGLQNDTEQRSAWLNNLQVANTIKWVLDADFDVPLIGIEPEKDPW